MKAGIINSNLARVPHKNSCIPSRIRCRRFRSLWLIRQEVYLANVRPYKLKNASRLCCKDERLTRYKRIKCLRTKKLQRVNGRARRLNLVLLRRKPSSIVEKIIQIITIICRTTLIVQTSRMSQFSQLEEGCLSLRHNPTFYSKPMI